MAARQRLPVEHRHSSGGGRSRNVYIVDQARRAFRVDGAVPASSPIMRAPGRKAHGDGGPAISASFNNYRAGSRFRRQSLSRTSSISDSARRFQDGTSPRWRATEVPDRATEARRPGLLNFLAVSRSRRVADGGCHINYRIRRVGTDGTINTIADRRRASRRRRPRAERPDQRQLRLTRHRQSLFTEASSISNRAFERSAFRPRVLLPRLLRQASPMPQFLPPVFPAPSPRYSRQPQPRRYRLPQRAGHSRSHDTGRTSVSRRFIFGADHQRRQQQWRGASEYPVPLRSPGKPAYPSS